MNNSVQADIQDNINLDIGWSQRTNNEYSLADNTVQPVTAENIVYPIGLIRPTHNEYLIEVNITPCEV